ncbi:laminin subunit gamma-2 [Chanos chanos]|uniref:Laminin subunit gamma-2 n=1 Tax=Chanos chanos TaxID=29144 RepID=A0A6J2VC95_CHACN|nr:laminin subunit gamma-2-like [Chanos chanos]
MNCGWILLCAFCIWSSVEGTYQHYARCRCNGKARYCTLDYLGPRCVNCEDNSEGRNCERCKDGFYHQRAEERCLPCHCNTAGSEGSGCDSQGRCVCKQGILGDKCDRCPNGSPVTPGGCEPKSEECLPCFCNGHSSECSSAEGYSVHTITSSFERGPEGWRVATVEGVDLSKVHFRWSPKHRDVEVISSDIRPVYLYAPSSFLGNQALSYGQNLAFSLRLDRGVRRPSTSDVVLEGAGLSVSASLGDLRTVVPCGQKINYAFRLDEQPGSKWKPQLSSLEFQKLLSNLTAIKIRGTFGENGRGYLDNVSLVSARQGAGTRAGWVEKCTCPAGYEGQFCERCANGYKRRFPGNGPLSPCEPCNCQDGSCDPETGKCNSDDQTPSDQACPPGQYTNPQLPGSCLMCPCPYGTTCSISQETSEVRCNSCPRGSTGSRCQYCEDGFYGNPLGENGPQLPCQPCQCNGHVDPNAVGICDRVTGECLKCLNNTTGFYCENCLEGFHHSRPTQACKACSCNPVGSLRMSCSDEGQCPCREGFEGQKCERSTCPACFNPVKTQMESYTRKLREIEILVGNVASDNGRGDSDEMKKTIKAMNATVAALKNRADTLAGSEKSLMKRMEEISQSLRREGTGLQTVRRTVDGMKELEQQYKNEVKDIERLLDNIEKKLLKAQREMRMTEFPQADEPVRASSLSGLVQKATDLADEHQSEAKAVKNTANSALALAEEALLKVDSIVNGENKIKERLNDLKRQYEADIAQVKATDKQATRVSSAADRESRSAENALKQLANLELNLPQPLQDDIDRVWTGFDALKNMANGNISVYQDLQKEVLADQRELEDQLKKAKLAENVYAEQLERANVAKVKADDALRDINNNLNGVEDALSKLRDFDNEFSGKKALADDAISRLPGINATIQQANRDNDQTQSVLDSLSDHYSEASDALGKLGGTVTRLEELSASLPPATELLGDAIKLKRDLDMLKTASQDTKDRLDAKVKDAEDQKADATKALEASTKAQSDADSARDAVGNTLKVVNDLLGSLGSPGTVDEAKVAELENAIKDARSRVDQELRPRLKTLEDKEAEQRALISAVMRDIDTILADLKNLEHIESEIPKGCYNTSPIERP